MLVKVVSSLYKIANRLDGFSFPEVNILGIRTALLSDMVFRIVIEEFFIDLLG